MDANSSCRSTRGDGSAVDSDDWGSRLPPDARQRIVNKIIDTLRRNTVQRPDVLNELKTIATRFEENTYSGATNQTDYLRQISLKMLMIETTFNRNLQDPVLDSMQYIELLKEMMTVEPNLKLTDDVANLHV